MPVLRFFASNDFSNIVEIIKQSGPYLALSVLAVYNFTWRGQERASRMTERIDSIEDAIHNALLFKEDQTG